jgi:hypothetical protein
MLRRLSPFGRFSLIAQIYLAFGLVAVLLVGTAGFAVYALAATDDDGKRADVDRRAATVKGAIEEFRRENLDAAKRAAVDELARVFDSYSGRNWQAIREIEAANRTVLAGLDRVGPPNRTAIQRDRDAATDAGRRELLAPPSPWRARWPTRAT